MPISSPTTLLPIEQKEFAQLDYQVMRHAFSSHGDLGRLCDEVIYKNDLARRLENAGIGPVHIEMPITVSHRTFRKVYLADLVVAEMAVYELKCVMSLANQHSAQLLNYLLLLNASHGKLINFREPKVESRFVNTKLTAAKQRTFEVFTNRWIEEDETTRALRMRMLEIAEDWGCFLELPLYLEALIYFFGGEGNVVHKLPLYRC